MSIFSWLVMIIRRIV